MYSFSAYKKNQIFGIRTLGEDYVVRKAIHTDNLNISERNLILIHFFTIAKKWRDDLYCKNYSFDQIHSAKF